MVSNFSNKPLGWIFYSNLIDFYKGKQELGVSNDGAKKKFFER
jgi:hypothetical protein